MLVFPPPLAGKNTFQKVAPYRCYVSDKCKMVKQMYFPDKINGILCSNTGHCKRKFRTNVSRNLRYTHLCMFLNPKISIATGSSIAFRKRFDVWTLFMR